MPHCNCMKSVTNWLAGCMSGLLLITILLPACKKDDDPAKPNSPDPDKEQIKEHAIPVPTPIVTSIITFVNGNGQTDNPVDLSVNNISSLYNPQYVAFHSNPLITDMYETRLSGRNLLTTSYLSYFDMQRVLPVTNSTRNYIDATIPKNQGSYFQLTAQRNGSGTLPDGATFTFGAPNPDPGGSQGSGYSAYMNPAASGVSLSMPSYTLDSAGSRWFLRSFGAWQFNFPVFDQADIKLTFNIPASMVNMAPDSIFCYSFKNWKWSKGGVAKKVNNTYVASFRGNGLWNFAVPVKGDYLKLKVRTDSAATITNTKLVAKVNALEVASARTDPMGNALIFVPVNEPITIELVDNDQVAKLTTTNIGAITNASAKEIIIPQKTSPYFVTINAKVLDCSGNPVQNGTAVLASYNTRPRQYYIPFQNGSFSTALYAYGGYETLYVTLFDAANKPIGAVNQVGAYGITSYANDPAVYNFNFYVCSNYKNLYCNYTLDGTSYFQKDDTGAPSSFLSAANANRITTQQGNLGIDIPFSFAFREGPWNYFSSTATVNGVTYQIVLGSNSVAYLYKLDPDAGGYTEGWVILTLKDNAGATHKLSATFRLKNKN